jgi:predicted solute-binding protein
MDFRFALPDTPLVDLLADVLASQGHAVVRLPEPAVKSALDNDDADIGLLPSLTLIQQAEDFEAVPGGAVTTWGNPFVRLLLAGELGAPVGTLAFNPAELQSGLVASLILREHYGQKPVVVPRPAVSSADLGTADAVVVTGEHALSPPPSVVALDVAQEWYELASYPMVWYLFATPKGNAQPVHRDAVVAAVSQADPMRAQYATEPNRTPLMADFYAESLGYRWDDLATASLTEWSDYLFQTGVLPELTFVSVAAFESDRDDEDEEEPFGDDSLGRAPRIDPGTHTSEDEDAW